MGVGCTEQETLAQVPFLEEKLMSHNYHLFSQRQRRKDRDRKNIYKDRQSEKAQRVEFSQVCILKFCIFLMLFITSLNVNGLCSELKIKAILDSRLIYCACKKPGGREKLYIV